MLDKLSLSGDDIIWWSEADGWGHLYRYDGQGELLARLTSGPWHVDGLLGVDAAQSTVFLTGNGREEGEDPYYKHTCTRRNAWLTSKRVGCGLKH